MRQPIAGQAVPGSWGALASRWAQAGIDLAGDVTLEAADDFLLRQAFLAAPVSAGAGWRAGARPGDHDPPQGVVGLPVATGVEPVPGDLPRGGGDRGGRAQVRPGGLGAEPLRAVPGSDQDRSSNLVCRLRLEKKKTHR